jgi:hypothetical protein
MKTSEQIARECAEKIVGIDGLCVPTYRCDHNGEAVEAIILAALTEATEQQRGEAWNMSSLLRRAIHRLPPSDPLRKTSMEYLKKIGMDGVVLRSAALSKEPRK